MVTAPRTIPAVRLCPAVLAVLLLSALPSAAQGRAGGEFRINTCTMDLAVTFGLQLYDS